MAPIGRRTRHFLNNEEREIAKMLNIDLTISGKEQKFTARGVNIRASYLAYDLYREYTMANGDYPQDLLDRCAEFVCACFGHAFSVDQLLDGYRGSAFRLYPAMLNAVITYTTDAIVNFPDPATAPEMGTAIS